MTGDITPLKQVDAGFACMTADKNGNLYLGNSVRGSIYFYDTSAGALRLFAGADDHIKFVDGPNPMFFEPRQLVYRDDALYVLDYNLFRRITINSADMPIAAETLAGKITADPRPTTQNGKASDAEIARNNLMVFVVTGGGGLAFSDPHWAVIRVVK